MTALIFDVETHKLHGDIIEAAWMDVNFVKNSSGEFIIQINYDHVGSQRYKPSEPIDTSAMAVHHIIDEDLENCPPSHTFRFPKGSEVEYLIGHNIRYDQDAIYRTDLPLSERNNYLICTLAMSRYLWPTFESHKLTTMIYNLFDHKFARELVKNAHQASSDVELTSLLLQKIIEKRNETCESFQKIESLEELYSFSEWCSDNQEYIFQGKLRGKRIDDLQVKDLRHIWNLLDSSLNLDFRRRLVAKLEQLQQQKLDEAMALEDDDDDLPF